MTAGNDVLADYTAGQHVTWDHTEVVVLDSDGPWLTVTLPGCDVGWSVHESEVSRR